ncbi:hypothetical protein [Planctomyces sp. SH-PL62]|uniref:hypothetical protein n=1 Tax=Planctomyces sp. SH-PL62 TaxID=1636152 RepID=UPI00078E2F9E|nr:hypothetical protein [Planctomyces sp. SH-PL62]AMV36746.1 hypothetical protein VT85_04900 [Planctomyces sp. SH-PL62]
MEPPTRFRYRPVCSAPGCEETAVYKAGALWSDGPRRELKNYGLACPEHRDAQLARARANRDRLKLEVGEVMGEIRLFRLDPDRRDTDLEDAPDEAPSTPPDPAG